MKSQSAILAGMCLFAALNTSPANASAADVCKGLWEKAANGLTSLHEGYVRGNTVNAFKSILKSNSDVAITADNNSGLNSLLLIREGRALSAETNVKIYNDELQLLLESFRESKAAGKMGSTAGQNWIVMDLAKRAGWIAETPEVQNQIIDLIREGGFDSSFFKYPRLKLEELLFQIASKPSVGFTKETIAFFDSVSLEDKRHLTRLGRNTITIDAYNMLQTLKPHVQLESIREQLQFGLDQFYKTGSTKPLEAWFEADTSTDNVSFKGPNGYYDQTKMHQAVEHDLFDIFPVKNQINYIVYKTLINRIKYGLETPDRAGPQGGLVQPRFVVPAIHTLFVLLSRIAREGGGDAELREYIVKGMTDKLYSALNGEANRLGVSRELDKFLAGNQTVDILANHSIAFEDVFASYANWKPGQ